MRHLRFQELFGGVAAPRRQCSFIEGLEHIYFIFEVAENLWMNF